MVRPWKELTRVMIFVAAAPRSGHTPYFLATLMAPSLASAPELAKNTPFHAGALAEDLAYLGIRLGV